MSEPQDGLKAVITQNIHGVYIIDLKEDEDGYERDLLWRSAYTLWGARRKARRMLAWTRKVNAFKGIEEVIR